MNRPLRFLAPALIVAATTALAHQGVKNPAVKARMAAMGQIGQETKVLGTMAKGKIDFDADQARAAAASIAALAAEAPALFETEADDPKSEALPSIWADFGDFTAKAEALEVRARAAAAAIATPEDLSQALAAIGATCKSCHQTYRE